MIRLIHNQTVSGAILVDDIDDGLPHATAHRLGSLGDPRAYERDGYANKPKQACYIPYSHTAPNGSSTAGFITLQQTNRVTMSAGKGKISKLVQAGLVSEVSGLTAAQFVTPTITASDSGALTVTGTTFLSVTPDVTTVTFAQGTGVTAPVPATLTVLSAWLTGSTLITIPAGAFAGGQVPVTGNTVTVTSNEQNSNTFTMT
jgi:hypothetical protein